MSRTRYPILVVLAVFIFGLTPVHAQSLTRAELDSEFRSQLASLAAKCEELKLPERARRTRACWFDRDPGRQYLFLPARDAGDKPVAPLTDLEIKWRAKLAEVRSAYAGRLFDLARGQSTDGSATTAYQLLHEVLHYDPLHADARRILGVTPDSARPRVRQPQVAQPKYGWARGKWWQVDTPHFQIVTDAGQPAGLELANRLEEFHTVWRQIFFEYWTTPAWLAERFAARVSPAPPERKHQVVLFRDRDEYVRQLSSIEPKIAVTLGYYLKGNRTSYFYWGDENAWSIWFHEAAHQLFQETGDPIRDVGEKWNFWVVEGIAVYLESAVRRDGYFTVGGFDADRLQFARARLMGGEPLLPLDELCGLGREALQQHQDIRRLYTQAAAITHYLMDGQRGRSRDEFVRKLGESYAGTDTPRTYLQFTSGAGANGLDVELREFLTVSSTDLAFLRPLENRRNLSLAGAQIDDGSLRSLAGSTRLEWLDLAYTSITDAGIENLGPLANLQQLTLVNTRVTDAVCPKLTPPALPRLQELDLSGTAITDAGLTDLKRLTNLKVLRLSHTRITDAGLTELSTLQQLEELDVSHTQVTDAALSNLKSQLPKLK